MKRSSLLRLAGFLLILAIPVALLLGQRHSSHQPHTAAHGAHDLTVAPHTSTVEATAPAARGRTYYVSKKGDNSDGRSWTTAWNELDQINWPVIQPGDTINLDGGSQQMIYTTTLSIGKSGTKGAPITITKASDAGHNGHVVIFGGRTIPLPYCNQRNYTAQTTGINATGIDVGNASWIVIEGSNWDGITIHGTGQQGVAFGSNSSNDIIRNLETYDNGNVLQSNGTSSPDNAGGGILVYGTNHLFEQVNIHDDAGDSFQPSGNNITINRSWLHQTREDPTQPGTPFNQCEHQDGYQIWGFNNHSTILIENSVISGQKEGVILGQAPIYKPSWSSPLWAVVNTVTLKNDLFLNKVIDIMGMGANPSNKKEHAWTIDHVTVYSQNTSVWVDGSANSITNSVFYGGHMWLPDGLANSSRNCQWKTDTNTSAVTGKTVDPQFVTDVSGYTTTTPLITIEQANFALQPTSPCLGAGSSITSVAQFLRMVAGASLSR